MNLLKHYYGWLCISARLRGLVKPKPGSRFGATGQTTTTTTYWRKPTSLAAARWSTPNRICCKRERPPCTRRPSSRPRRPSKTPTATHRTIRAAGFSLPLRGAPSAGRDPHFRRKKNKIQQLSCRSMANYSNRPKSKSKIHLF